METQPASLEKPEEKSVLEQVRTSIQNISLANPITSAKGNVAKIKTSISNSLNAPLQKLRESIVGTLKKIPSIHQVRASLLKSLKTSSSLQPLINKSEKKKHEPKVKAWTLCVQLDTDYKPVFQKDKKKADVSTNVEEKRTNGDKNLDLWTVGDIYPADPRSGTKPQFNDITDFMKFVGAGEKGLLGYCKALANNAIVPEPPPKIDSVKKAAPSSSVSEKKTTPSSPRTNLKSTLLHPAHGKLTKVTKDRLRKSGRLSQVQKHHVRKSKINLAEKASTVVTPRSEISNGTSIESGSTKGMKGEAKSAVSFKEKPDVKLIGKKKTKTYPYALTKKLNLMNQRIKLSADQRFDGLNRKRAKLLTFDQLGVLYLKPHSIEEIKKLKALFRSGGNPFSCSHVLLN